MQRKKTAAAIATEPAAQAALRRAATTELSPEEERVMRMRLGAVPPQDAPLERLALPESELGIELLAAEIEAHLRWREHEAQRALASPRPSRVKEKIVRALRRKG
ncbi:MAG TPA: hypothetical protein VFG59_19215 [Anaeromyxobacter sp.]|nr:hypothetical protein [Anaeromyxobacter sp.]